jgi:23S rRNA (adenine-N6)-dimethyltransferase
VARRLVRAAAVGPGDLVFDLGAGAGAITLPLARTGARVLAVERDPRVAHRLAADLEQHDNVRVITGDALSVPLPGRPFVVVANIPFAITTAIVRRLVGSPMTGAHLVVERGAARRLCAAVPGRPELLGWQAAVEFQWLWPVPAHCFRPPPAVDGAVLRMRRRPQPPPRELASLLRYAFRSPHAPASRVVGRAAARRAGIEPGTPVLAVTATQWLATLRP